MIQNAGSSMDIEEMHLDQGTVRITTGNGITALQRAGENSKPEMAGLLKGWLDTKTTAVRGAPRLHIRKLFVREGAFNIRIENGGATIQVEELRMMSESQE